MIGCEQKFSFTAAFKPLCPIVFGYFENIFRRCDNLPVIAAELEASIAVPTEEREISPLPARTSQSSVEAPVGAATQSRSLIFKLRERVQGASGPRFGKLMTRDEFCKHYNAPRDAPHDQIDDAVQPLDQIDETGTSSDDGEENSAPPPVRTARLPSCLGTAPATCDAPSASTTRVAEVRSPRRRLRQKTRRWFSEWDVVSRSRPGLPR